MMILHDAGSTCHVHHKVRGPLHLVHEPVSRTPYRSLTFSKWVHRGRAMCIPPPTLSQRGRCSRGRRARSAMPAHRPPRWGDFPAPHNRSCQISRFILLLTTRMIAIMKAAIIPRMIQRFDPADECSPGVTFKKIVSVSEFPAASFTVRIIS